MKKSLLIVALVGGALAFQSCCKKAADSSSSEEAASVVSGGERLGWRLGSQAYTFKEFTFAEALDKLDSIGLKYVEVYPGQKIGAGMEGTTHFTANAEARTKIKQLADEKGIKMVCYGVATANNEEDWRAIFEFARDLGIETITSEPAPEFLPLVDSLCNEYGVNLAIHNHPKPSRYWDPAVVLEALEGRSERMGACADVGHWIRSGLEPVECLKQLEGKIISLHFKDLNEKSREAHDVPWGTGISDVKAMLAELKRQDFKGVFSVEYEYNWKNSLPEVDQSVQFFHQTADEM